MELLDRHSEGVIALTGCLQSRFCRRLVEDRPDDARAHARRPARRLRRRATSTSRSRRTGSPSRTRPTRGSSRDRRASSAGRWSATADVHYLRREDYDNHAALLCVQTKSTLEQPKLTFDTNEFFLKSPERDGGVVRRLAGGGADDARDRRALRGRDRARQAAAAALPDPRRRGAARRCCAGSPSEGLRAPLRRPGAGRGARAARVRARRDRRDGLRVLLPDRLGLRPLREGERDRGRPGPRLGRRLDRRLLRSTSPTSTRSPTTCCSSASSTRPASRCPTSTSTSRSAAASG